MPAKKRQTVVERHDPNMREAGRDSRGIAWHSPFERPMRLEGMGWRFNEPLFRRMPQVDDGHPLPESVDALAWCTAGIQVRFRTDSSRVVLRVKLRGPSGMDHMPATGQCGFDLYAGDFGSSRYVATTRVSVEKTEFEVTLAQFKERAKRTLTLNFPLYQGVNDVAVGLDEKASVSVPPPWRWPRPVIVYGTSITQGGCAARPGMAYTNILSRRLGCEFVNLGFSGSGRGEPEVARAIATLPAPQLYVMDYESNCHEIDKMKATLPGFLATLRAAWPSTPLLVLTKNRYARERFNPEEHKARLARAAYQRRLVERLRRAGDRNVFFLYGGNLLGRDFDECAVDGVHPTDLGFYRMAEGLEKPLRKLLGPPKRGA